MEFSILDDLEIYKISDKLSNQIWKIVISWNYFDRDTLGKQLVRATDSISINIAEAYGRFYYKEKKLFCYYARGSLFESKSCLLKANSRNLIDEDSFNQIINEMDVLLPKLNGFIKSLSNKGKE